MKKVGLLSLVFSILVATSTDILALPPFKKAFEAKYTDKEKNEAFSKLVRKTGCNVCHVKGAKKNFQNAYGHQLAALVKGNAKERMDAVKEAGTDEKKAVVDQLLKELDKAFEAVAKKPKLKDSKVKWGDFLKESKLPVSLEEQALEKGKDRCR